MWCVVSILLLVQVHAVSSAKPHVSCERDFKKIGCFNAQGRPDVKDMQLLITDRDTSSPYHDGYLINWREFRESVHSLACRCAEKAKSLGYQYMSIRFWGECHGGKDASKVTQFLKDNVWKSQECSNPFFQICQDENEHECAGKAGADYIYFLNSGSSAKDVDGGLTQWSEWTECPVTCGENYIQERERSCTNPVPEGNGKSCGEELTETKPCEIPKCPINGGLSEWSEFSTCSSTCGGGTMKRFRKCNNPEPANGGAHCSEEVEEEKPCSNNPCPVNGGFNDWSEFTVCSASCGEGSQSSSRECNNPKPQFGGQSCDSLGDKVKSKSCKVKECPIDGQYGPWSAYSPCIMSCGGGTRLRVRLCNSPSPQHGGKDCDGDGQQTEKCGTDPCPVDGVFSEWSEFSTCSQSCGVGKQDRRRSCSNPEPKYGGNECVGPVSEERQCNNGACPVNGAYGQWSEYSTCTKSCGTGSQTRSRKCNNPEPQHGGKDCSEAATETQECNRNPCAVDGGWSEYSAYGDCTKLCGGGIQIKLRYCTNPKPEYGGKDCEGRNTYVKVCNTQPCPVDGGYGSWSGFSSCSASCGGGRATRSRSCNNPSPSNGGQSCERFGAATDSQNCNTHACPLPLSPQKLERTCEHRTMNLNCGHGGRIEIESASYGRTSSDHCSWIFWFSRSCHAGSSHHQVVSRCNNQQSCSVAASNSVFGDPCFGTVKYLEVRYRCRGGPYTR